MQDMIIYFSGYFELIGFPNASSIEHLPARRSLSFQSGQDFREIRKLFDRINLDRQDFARLVFALLLLLP
jgi:hypothetical protein